MRLSKEKRDRISEQILSVLYDSFPSSVFTAKIAESIARDEEFIKALMLDLQAKQLVACIRKNSEGIPYSRRQRWRLSNKAYDVYKQAQPVSTQQASTLSDYNNP